jgi:hypothetical protein
LTTGRVGQGAAAWQVPIIVMTLVKEAQHTPPPVQSAPFVQPPAASPPPEEEPPDEEAVPSSPPPSPVGVAVDDELLQPAATARPNPNDATKRIFVLCMGKTFLLKKTSSRRSVASATR